MPPIRFCFRAHGLGDVCHAAAVLRLYMADGYDVQLQVEENKRWVWEAAGVPLYDGPDQLPDHPYNYPNMDDFWDISQPDHTYSKIAHFCEFNALPRLGTKEQIWDRLCQLQIDATAAVSPQALESARQLIEGLPAPITLLHSKGSNWQGEKSIPDATAFALIREIVETGEGSVITLDWDSRSPTLDHPRVRPAGRLPLDVFGALCMLADVMIGVDSGPFHLAAWFPIPTLFVMHKIPPVRCCLPSPHATYLVPARDGHHWDARGLEWNFQLFQGEFATTTDIINAAQALETQMDSPATHHTPPVTPDAIPGRYVYTRCGHDERHLELLPEGQIGDGAAGCERGWKLVTSIKGQTLIIHGDGGRDTCHLRLMPDGIWRGQWIRAEKMPIELKWDQPPEPPPTIAMIMNWDADYQQIADLVSDNRSDYAQRHGYQLHISHYAGSWGKLDAILDAWDTADWLWWLDTDAAITNPDQRLEDLIGEPRASATGSPSVILTTDRNGLNAGSMLIRTTPEVLAILEDLRARRADFDSQSKWWEQTGLAYLFWKINALVKVIPQRTMNSYPLSPGLVEPPACWEPGDFVMHCAGMTNPARIALLRPICKPITPKHIERSTSDNKLNNMHRFLTTAPPGIVVEIGVWKGGSLRFLAEQHPDRQFIGFDTFEGMPKTSPKDNHHKQGDFGDTSFEAVTEALADLPNVTLIKGVFPECRAAALNDQSPPSIALAHVDVDIYESTLNAFRYLRPHMVTGGRIYCDDAYQDTCQGATLALNQFSAEIGLIPVFDPDRHAMFCF